MKRTKTCPLCKQDVALHRFDVNLLTGGLILVCPKKTRTPTKKGGTT